MHTQWKPTIFYISCPTSPFLPFPKLIPIQQTHTNAILLSYQRTLFQYFIAGVMRNMMHGCCRSPVHHEKQIVVLSAPVREKGVRVRKQLVIDVQEEKEDNCLMPNSRRLMKYERKRLLKLVGMEPNCSRQVQEVKQRDGQGDRGDKLWSIQQGKQQQEALNSQLEVRQGRSFALEQIYRKKIRNSSNNSYRLNPEKVYFHECKNPVTGMTHLQ